MGDHLDVPLEDAVLLEEVELISSLMIAASEHADQDHLDQGEIDELLGLSDAAVPEQPSGRVPERPSGRRA